MKKSKQLSLIKKEPSAYGGELRNTRKGRTRPRPLATRETMHLILKSSKAKGAWSFRHPRHQKRIEQLVRKFALKYGVQVLSMANVGNHLHFQIKLAKRFLYAPFIRAVTGAIAVVVTRTDRGNNQVNESRNNSGLRSMGPTGASRCASGSMVKFRGTAESRGTVGATMSVTDGLKSKLKFWDHRPFTRVVQSLKAVLYLKDYIQINQLEGQGYQRDEARMIIEMNKDRKGFG